MAGHPSATVGNWGGCEAERKLQKCPRAAALIARTKPLNGTTIGTRRWYPGIEVRACTASQVAGDIRWCVFSDIAKRCWIGAIVLTTTAPAEPLRLHPDNPHYFLWRGKPAVLVTSGEHYGAVLNGAFDFRKYLDTLAADRLNLTRVFTGLYREVPGVSFGIARNTLAPEEANYIQPFRRTAPQKYDLSQWNDDYFRRWKDFAAYAGQKDIIIEVTLFTSYYNEKHWAMSPLNAANNAQGIGKVTAKEVLTSKEPALVEVQERFVRKLVTELKDFDNIYYEICNEPYADKVPGEWQSRMAKVVADTEAAWPERRHLVSLNIANGAREVQEPAPNISIYNFHYSRPPHTVAMNYGLDRPIGMNETGFDGAADATYRIQGWDFLLAGGALYNNLDYSFTADHEDGTFQYPGTQPGGGTVRLRKQLKGLRDFMNALPFVTMRPDTKMLKGNPAEGLSARVLSDGSSVWALYVHGGRPMDGYSPKYVVYSKRGRHTLEFDLPAGDYEVQWWNPSSGSAGQTETLRHGGGAGKLQTPEFSGDVAAIIRKRGG